MIEDVKENVKRSHPSLSRKRQIKFKDLTSTDENLQANLQAEIKQENKMDIQQLQITGFKQNGAKVTIYFNNGKSRKTTADRLFNINKPSKAEGIVKRVRKVVGEELC